jgi:hypothetical protein
LDHPAQCCEERATLGWSEKHPLPHRGWIAVVGRVSSRGVPLSPLFCPQLFCSFPPLNPEGVKENSPGSRRATGRYPGKPSPKKISNPESGCTMFPSRRPTGLNDCNRDAPAGLDASDLLGAMNLLQILIE